MDFSEKYPVCPVDSTSFLFCLQHLSLFFVTNRIFWKTENRDISAWKTVPARICTLLNLIGDYCVFYASFSQQNSKRRFECLIFKFHIFFAPILNAHVSGFYMAYRTGFDSTLLMSYPRKRYVYLFFLFYINSSLMYSSWLDMIFFSLNVIRTFHHGSERI